MKLFHKIAVTTLGLAMATAVGAGLIHQNHKEAKLARAATEEAMIYSEDFEGWTADSNYNNGGGSADEIVKPADDTATNKWNTYYVGLASSKSCINGKSMMMRAYKNSGTHSGYISTNFSLEKVTKFSFDIKVGSSSLNQGYNVFYKTSSSGSWNQIGSSVTFSDTSVHNVEHVISNTGAYDQVWIKIEFLSDVNTDTKNNYDVYVDNIVAYGMVEASAATNIVFSDYPTSMNAGETCEIEATIDSNTESIQWTISNSNVAILSYSVTQGCKSTATLVAINNGSFTVTAQASVTTSVQTVSSTITVSGASTSNAPITVTPGAFGITTNTYNTWNGYHVYKGVVFETKAIAKQPTDYVDKDTGDVLVYEQDAFLIQANNGMLRLKTNSGHAIKSVLVSGVSETAPNLTVKGGANVDEVTETAELSSVGKMHKYTFSSAVNYVTIQNGAGAAYVNSFTFDYDGGEETALSLSEFILGIMPSRNDDTGFCKGSNGNYQVAKARFLSASAAVKQSFQTSEDETIVAARTRYLAWASAYGDGSPFESAQSSNSLGFIGLSSISAILITTLAIISISSFAVMFIIRKRKEQR